MKSVAQVLYRRLRATSALVSYSPASLFASGEQGVWLDNSDFTTLFQDAAGTTPVTGYEQFVGLRLDKSKGLILGSELVSNGTFDSDTSWTKGTGWTISGGVASSDGSQTSSSNLSQAAGLVDGKLYKVTFTVLGRSAGQVRPVVGGGGAGSYVSANGTYSQYVVCVAGPIFYLQADADFVGTIDNISVRELPGNHAFQSTTTARAVLSARYNLLTKTENFAAAAWSKVGATVDPTKVTAPNGTLTAELITFASGTSEIFQLAGPLGAGGTGSLACTGAVYVKGTAGETVHVYDGYTVKPPVVLTGDWQRITTSVTGTNRYLDIGATNGATARNIYLWGADLRVANESSALPAYQRVGAAVNGTSTVNGVADYDTVGFPAYLRYDGGDWYQTNSIDFTATDKMSVFAGVRKFNAAGSFAILAELSSAAYLNPGSFAIAAPGGLVGNTDNFGFTLVGSGTAGYDAVSYPPPFTAILAVQYNIGAASPSEEVVPRINAVLNQTGGAGTTAGTGTFGNYPLYIGARNAGASLPFTGREYETIVLGRAVTATELANTEDYMETQTFGKNMAYVYSDELTTSLGDLITAADGDQIYMQVSYV